ncbi:sigma-70 family RNA polymerase sigma factor [Streptomyces sp. NPDC051976]|uniref:RNA polymerase sigma factor n=1 Tax=Streptomyces sp. NPDC051976 TaxID=3154947 RepID=UPI00343F83DA
MDTKQQPGADVVAAARDGDPRAVETLVAGYLPLVYSIVGRALNGHADVDDVVQETMLKIVGGVGQVRETAQFRSWAVAVAMNQIREHRRSRTARSWADPLVEGFDAVDSGADFVDLTILRLSLSGQRREVVEATRWLDREDSALLSLWWLETAGRLTRAEIAATLQLSGHHVAVRVDRLKARLNTGRMIVRALDARPVCPDLRLLTTSWDGGPSGLWRKRLGRHVRDCQVCSARQKGLVPLEGLLAPLALVPLPAALLALRGWAAKLGTAAQTASPVTPVVTGSSGTAASAPALSGAATAGGATAGKAVALVCAGILAVGGGAALTLVAPWHHGSPAPLRASSAPPAGVPPTVPSTVSAAPTATPRPRASRLPLPLSGVYGSVVDSPDAAPPAGLRPRALPRRPEGTLSLTSAFQKRSGAGYQIVHRGDAVTIRGRGYFAVHWQVMFAQRSGMLTMPSWTGLRGRLFHVASGGGHRMDDPDPGTTGTWMGNATDGRIVLPPGAQQMWQQEFYYLDGSVTVHLNETAADYNLDVWPSSWTAVTADVTTAPSPGSPGTQRFGLVRDNGLDTAPVPQYLTRGAPADPLSVPQRSELR